MASIANDPGGKKRITFTGADGKRKTLRLGKSSMRNAERVQTQVESLLAAQLAGASPPRETSAWLAELDAVMRKRLAAVGLAEAPQAVEAPPVPTLGDWIDSYAAKRTDVKPATIEIYLHARRNAVDFFGTDKPLAEITEGGAEDFRRWLVTDQKLSGNTARRRCSIVRQFLASAVKHRLISVNPFAEQKDLGVRENREREYFLTPADAAKVIDKCPDVDWRLIFALARWGGLRTPSETLALRWADVDWAASRVNVRSPKTEHHEGKEQRAIPIFPELRPYLEAAWDAAPEGAEFVVSRYRDSRSNLRTHAHRIIAAAGLTPWPKTFQNLRSSRETELVRSFPIHVVCQWLGNSVPVAAKHYLQVTAADFDAGAKVAHNAAQNTSASVGTDRNSVPAE